MRPARLRVRAPAMRAGRQSQSIAVLVASSTMKPLPSQRSSGHPRPSPAPAGLVTCRTGSPRGEPWRSLRVALARVVHELRILLLEGQGDFADRSVAVLGDQQVGLARAL